MSFFSPENFNPLSRKKIDKLTLTPAEQKEALIKGLGQGAREEAQERKPDGFEKKHRVEKNKKKYSRRPKHGKDPENE